MSEDERKVLQTLGDESFKGFKEIVVHGRPKFKSDEAALNAVATGQVFTAQQALAKGLVDAIGFIEAAVARATELAGETPESVRCVKYERRPTLIGELIGADSHLAPARSTVDIATLIDLASPRAYYLWSLLPNVLSSHN